MGRNQTKADMLLKRLKGIRQSIKELEREMEASRTVISSPQWNDMKVKGGIKQTQTDKNVAIIDQSDWYLNKIVELQKDKIDILDSIYKLDDIVQINVLIAGYLTYDSFQEAWFALNMSDSTFYNIKRNAIRKLNEVISS